MTVDFIKVNTNEDGKEEKSTLLIEQLNNSNMDEKEMDHSDVSICPITGARSGQVQNARRPVKVTNFSTACEHFDRLHQKTVTNISCNNSLCYGSMMAGQSVARPHGVPRPKEEIIAHAKEFIEEYYKSMNSFDIAAYEKRLSEVLNAIETTGTYDLTYDELTYGAKLAWRNAPRCIGRIQWQKLHVFDCRHIKTTDQMFKAICEHLIYATNDGNIRSAITIFPKREVGKPDFRVWNPQLLSYAGYQQEDGTVIGDPGRVQLTQICEKLGWKGKGGMFDVLPLVLNASGEDPKFYEIPPELVLEVQLKHPEYSWFEDMGLKWYAVPAVADMLFDIGGLEFPGAPFNGWYMSTEIGTRNLCDPQRYNILDEVAIKMGLDTSSTVNLWKDQALVEINIAVLYSFQLVNVTIMDHHTASESFIKHMANEQKLRGGCPADWVWIVPPLSGGITSVFHQEMVNYVIKPSYEYQVKAWKTHEWINKEMEKVHRGSGKKFHLRSAARAILFASYLMNKYMRKRVKATILYASETGKSEAYARRIGEIFRRAFNPQVYCMDEYPVKNLTKESLVLIVTSTFGSGEAPDNGKAFGRDITKIKRRMTIDVNNNTVKGDRYIPLTEYVTSFTGDGEPLSKSKFAVFALGSSAYPDFCEFGKFCDTAMAAFGSKRLLPVATGDELKGQEQSFKKWANNVFKAACQNFGIKYDFKDEQCVEEEETWSPDMYRLMKASEQFHDLYEGLSKLHNRTVLPCRMISRTQLQSTESDRKTILARFDTKGAQELQYNPGDHLGVFPTNRQEIVLGISRRLKNVPNLTDVLMVQTVDKENSRNGRTKSWKSAGRLPPCSLLTALYHYLDITSPPTQHFLKLLAKSASDEIDRQKLEKLANYDEHYEAWKSSKYPHLWEVLQEFQSVRIDGVLLLTQVPVLQPRFYSISSSAQFCHGEVHATVGVVSYNTQGGAGPMHFGVCSTFLNSFPNKDIPCFIRRAPSFYLPEDTSRPIIMIGPGTGIAPYRSFWQQRQHELKEFISSNGKKSWLNFRCANIKAEYGKMTLYFGCRHPALDDIYHDEIVALTKLTPLFKVRTAYSRLPGKPKTYVQHLLEEDQAHVYRHIVKERGHFYVCGEASMAADVRATLKTILKEQGNMTQEEAEDYFQLLKEDGQFHEDIFGVLLKCK